MYRRVWVALAGGASVSALRAALGLAVYYDRHCGVNGVTESAHRDSVKMIISAR